MTPEEQEVARHLLWFAGHADGWQPGSFSESLIATLSRADLNNKEKLLKAFPEYRRPMAVMEVEGASALSALLSRAE